MKNEYAYIPFPHSRCDVVVLLLLCLCVLCVEANALTPSNDESWIDVRPLSAVNTADDEYAPSWCTDRASVVLTQERKGRARLMEVTNEGVRPFFIPDIDSLAQVSYSTWSHDGVMVFSMFRSIAGRRVMNLMERKASNGVWSPSHFIPECLYDNFSSHATISPSGNTLVFVSDREGGVGNTDLWMCSRSGQGWDTPMHVGDLLNSADNEITPFLAGDDTLYFASNGFGGKGGYDVFRTVKVSGEWQPPVPVESINTSYDESDFVIIPDGTAFFASDRPGGKGGLDVYTARKK